MRVGSTEGTQQPELFREHGDLGKQGKITHLRETITSHRKRSSLSYSDITAGEGTIRRPLVDQAAGPQNKPRIYRN